MLTMHKMCLGTWQFENLSDFQVEGIIEAAYETGIHQFDTAPVYASGRAEELLGKFCSDLDIIITKIPSKSKLETDFSEAYSSSHVTQCLEISIERLRRPPDVVLLHNWRNEWENTTLDQIEDVRKTIELFGINKFGISLPNSYQGEIEESNEYEIFDVIELPFNTDSPSLTSERLLSMTHDKTIYARSLLRHGEDSVGIQKKFKNALGTGAHIVVGASSTEQVKQWKEWL